MKAVEMVGYSLLGVGAVGLVAVAAVSVSVAGTMFVVVHAKESYDGYRKDPVGSQRTRRGRAWHYAHRAVSYVPRRTRAIA